MSVVRRVVAAGARWPVARGMAAYAVLWPVSSLVQQALEPAQRPGAREPINWARAFRYGLFGSCFVAPSLFLWIRFSTKKWPGKDLATCVKKAFIEQVTYGPFAMTSFYFGMSALEMKPVQACVDEVKLKAWPTFKVGICVWPVIQTFNHYFIPEKNKVVFVSVASLLWTCFLAHMKSLDKEKLTHKPKHIHA